ncbi:hypothetical protein HY375_02265 [Candidatus Berkelbacteria bacterium]|nr:hypothetical protein [Candidatus Berkelbacteria bacterium]
MAIPGGGGPGAPPVPGSTPPNPDAAWEKQARKNLAQKLGREGLGFAVSLLGFSTHIDALNSGKDLVNLVRAGVGTAQGTLMGGVYGERLGLQNYAAEQATETQTLLASLEQQDDEDDTTWETRLKGQVPEVKQRLRQEILILRANERMGRYGSVINEYEHQAAQVGWGDRIKQVFTGFKGVLGRGLDHLKAAGAAVKSGEAAKTLKSAETYKRGGRAALNGLKILGKMVTTWEGIKALGKAGFYWGTPLAATIFAPALAPAAYSLTLGVATVERGVRVTRAVKEYNERAKAPAAVEISNPRIKGLLDALVTSKEITDDEAMRKEMLEFLEADEFEGLKEADYLAIADRIQKAGATGVTAGMLTTAATYGILGLRELGDDKPTSGSEAQTAEATAATTRAAEQGPIKSFFSWIFPDWTKSDAAEQAQAAAGNGAAQPALGPEDEPGVDGPAGPGAGAEGGTAGGVGAGDGGGVGNGGAGGVGDPGSSGGAGDGTETGTNDGTSGGAGAGEAGGVGNGEGKGVMGSDELPGVLGPKPAPGVEQPPTPEPPPPPPVIAELEKPATGEVHPFGEPFQDAEKKWWIYLDINGDATAADAERFELKHENNRWYVEMKYFDTDGDGRIASTADVLDTDKEKVRLYYDAQTSWGGWMGEKLTLQTVGGKETWSSEAIYAVDKDEWMRHKLGEAEWNRIRSSGSTDEASVGAAKTETNEYGFVPRKGLIATLGNESPADSVPEVQITIEDGKPVGMWHGGKATFEGATITDDELKQLSKDDPLIEASIKSSSLYYQESSLTFKSLTIEDADRFAQAIADPTYRDELPTNVAEKLDAALTELPTNLPARQRALEDIFGAADGTRAFKFSDLVAMVQEKAAAIEFPTETALQHVPGKAVSEEDLTRLIQQYPQAARGAVEAKLNELKRAMEQPGVAGFTVNYLDDKAYVRVVETDGDVLKKVILPKVDVEAALRSR